MKTSQYTSLLKTFSSNHPSTMTIFVTNLCNARCRMCFNWQEINKSDINLLTLQEYETIAQKLKHLHALIISGGEPFLRKDLNEIIKAFNVHARTRQVAIPTNGFSADIPGMFEKILHDNPNIFFRLLIGVDDIGNKHDDIRKVKNGFKKVERNIQALHRLKNKFENFQVNVTTVFMKENQDHIESIADYIDRLPVDEHKVLFIRGDIPDKALGQVSGEKYLSAVRHFEKLTRKRLKSNSIYSRLFSAVNLYSREMIIKTVLEEKAQMPCLAGKKIIVLRENGDLYPCELLDRKIGNVRESAYDIRTMLQSSKAREAAVFIKESQCHCTQECMMVTNMVYNWRTYFPVFKKFLSIQ